MKKLTTIVLCGMLLSTYQVKATSPHVKIGKIYTISGIEYKPKLEYNYTNVGIASWYGGSDVDGKLTANGEIFNKFQLTAAHKTLALPSYVKVTNLENQKQVILRVNDRGPYKKNRIIDVSQRAAELLGFKEKGTAKVKVEILPHLTKEKMDELNYNNQKQYLANKKQIQVKAFKPSGLNKPALVYSKNNIGNSNIINNNAMKPRAVNYNMQANNAYNAPANNAAPTNMPVNNAYNAPANNAAPTNMPVNNAYNAPANNAAPTNMPVSNAYNAPANNAAPTNMPVSNAYNAPANNAVPANMQGNQNANLNTQQVNSLLNNSMHQYTKDELTSPEVLRALHSQSSAINYVEPSSVREYLASSNNDNGSIYVQIGVFSNNNINAFTGLEELNNITSVSMERMYINDKPVTKVKMGPFTNINEALMAKKQLEELGYNGAGIVVDNK